MHNGRPPYFFWQEHDEPMHRQMHHKSQQIYFHPQWAELLQQVRIPRFRCTRDIPKFQTFAKRPRTDSEELNLKLANLWIAPLVLIYLIFYHLLHQSSPLQQSFSLAAKQTKVDKFKTSINAVFFKKNPGAPRNILTKHDFNRKTIKWESFEFPPFILLNIYQQRVFPLKKS